MQKLVAVLSRELREIAPAALFFLITFNMIAVTKTVILAEYRITMGSTTIATILALTVAKTILIMDKLPLAGWFASRPIYNVLWRTLLFALVTFAFRLLEELLPLLRHRENFVSGAQALLADMSWPHFLIVQMWLISLLFMYCTVIELNRLMATDNAWPLLFARRVD